MIIAGRDHIQPPTPSVSWVPPPASTLALEASLNGFEEGGHRTAERKSSPLIGDLLLVLLAALSSDELCVGLIAGLVS